MTLLVTGGTGFVMAVVARRWLDRDPAARAVVLDQSPLDASARRYFEPVSARLTVVQADVTDAEAVRRALSPHAISRVVHGATVTPISRGTVEEASREPERDDPARILEVNLMGTVRLLDWARAQPGIRRFVYVSSGAVYRQHGPDDPGRPLPEDGYVAPRRLYGISKQAAELVTARYAALFGLSAVSVRLSSVYGPMDRPTASRDFRHVPNRIAQLARASRPIRVNSFEGVGDYLNSEDAAEAICRVADAPALVHSVYNVAAGEVASVGEIIGWARERYPTLTAEQVAPRDADIVTDSGLRGGMWGAYEISRIAAETGWRPRPGREAFHAYLDFLAAYD